MVTQEKAGLTLAYHQGKLLKNHNLAYLSVVSRVDEKGCATKDYYIEAGVIRMDVQEAAYVSVVEAKGVMQGEEFVPSRLQIPSESDVTTLTDEFVAVDIVESGEITTLSFTDRRRPCAGGNSVGNPRYNSAGTLGAPITIQGDSKNLYFLSNWHVLVGGAGRHGDPLIQPGRLDGGHMPGDKIGTLHWSALNANLDAAVGKADRRNLLRMGTRCYGNLTLMGQANVGMAVKKCGRTSRATTGIIRSINATVRVSGYPSGTKTFRNQVQTTFMLSPGDSGSVLINNADNRVVGLGFSGGNSQSFHNHIGNISSATLKITSTPLLDGSEGGFGPFRISGFILEE